MSLGQLIVRLGLDAVEYTTGLTVAEVRAKKFAQTLDRGISTAANAAGVAIAGIGTAAAGAFVAIDRLAKSASKFKDMEEITGGSAESLAGLALAAGTSGIAMESISSASVKLTRNLLGVDDESKAAGAALAALGIPLEAFKRLDPASQFEAVGKAMAKFADSTAKTAVATALFGKAGAETLPFLKQLAEDGGRTIILTQAQIDQADAYADAQAKLRTEIELYAQAIAIEATPAMIAFTKALRDTVADLIGLDQATRRLDGRVVAEFAERIVTALGFIVDATDGVIRAFQYMGTAIGAGLATQDAARRLDFKAAKAIALDAQKDLQAILERPLFSTKVAKNIADAKALAAAPLPKQPDLRRPVNFTGAISKTGKAGGEDPDAAVRRILQGQIKELERSIAQEKDILSAYENFLGDYYGRGEIAIAKYYDQLQEARDTELRNVLAFIDKQIALQEARAKSAPKEAERIDAANKVAELKDRENKLTRDAITAEESLGRKRKFATEDYLAQLTEINAKILEMNGNTADATAIRAGAQFKLLRFQAAERGDTAAVANIDTLTNQAVQQAKLNDETRKYSLIIDANSNAFARIDLARSIGSITEIDSLNKISAANSALIPILQKRIDAQTIIANGFAAGSPEQQAALQGIDNIKLKMEELATQTNLVADKFNKMFTDSFADAFASVIDGTSSVKDAFKSLERELISSLSRIASKQLSEALFGQMLGGSTGGGFSAMLASWFGGGFASGGTPPIGKLSIVGEKGPEWFVPKVAGTILPNKSLGGNVFNINVNVPAGTTRATSDQIARDVGSATSRAMRSIG